MSETTAGVPGEIALSRRRLLGLGLRADLVDSHDLTRDLTLRSSAAGVDLDVVDGIDALTQALAIGLTTLRGSDPFNVRFGFLGLAPLTDATPAEFAREALRGAVAQLVAEDPRVRRVVDVRVAAPTGGSRALAVTVEFETVSGDPAIVTVTSPGPPPPGLEG